MRLETKVHEIQKSHAQPIEIDDWGDEMVLTIEFLKNNLIFSCRNQASKITQINGDEKLKNTPQAFFALHFFPTWNIWVSARRIGSFILWIEWFVKF